MVVVLSQPPTTDSRTPMPAPPSASGAVVVSASVLAVTDDPVVRDLLLEMALADGFGVRCAATEAEAAKLLHRERPGLLLADLDMAGRAGVKFLRTLKQSLYRDIACVAVTASNNPMLSVAVDAPVFYKPGLDGLDEALGRLFASKSGGGGP
jgi:CheY-like chemotaxis protein